MISEANIRESALAAMVYEIQRAAYGVEAERIGVADFPPLRQSLEDVRGSRDIFPAWIREGSVRGCLSYEVIPPLATITRWVVDPLYFRQGIASALLRALESRLAPGSVVCGFTAALNAPAIRAYEKNGYETEEAPTREGIRLRRVRKTVGGGHPSVSNNPTAVHVNRHGSC